MNQAGEDAAAVEQEMASALSLRLSMLPAVALTAGSIFFDGRDAADEANDESPYFLRDDSRHAFGILSTFEPIYFPFKSRRTKTRFRRETEWFAVPLEGPFQGLQIPISQKEHENFLQKMHSAGHIWGQTH